MSLQEISGPVREWDAAGLKTCVALLFRVEGSSPRPPGSRLAINEHGDMAGFISLGCVEGDVREHVRQVLDGGPSRIVHYGVADADSMTVGLSCGGQIDVLLTRHNPMDPVWQSLAADRSHDVQILFTLITGPGAGRHLLWSHDQTRTGTLGAPALDDEAVRAAENLRGTTLLELSSGVTVLAEWLPPPLRLAIVGATPVAVALCQLAAAVGMDVTVIDPRRDFVNAQLFPDARRIVVQWPEEGLSEAGVNPDWFVAVLSHDPKLDLPGLAAALRVGCRYIGLLGGRKTQAARRSALREMGFPEADLNRLRGPIGLRIGAIPPHEIAVSILAEMIATSRGATPTTDNPSRENHA